MTDFNINGWDWPDYPRGPSRVSAWLRHAKTILGETAGDAGIRLYPHLAAQIADYIEELEAERDRECVWTKTNTGLVAIPPHKNTVVRGEWISDIENGNYNTCPECGGKVVVK